MAKPTNKPKQLSTTKVTSNSKQIKIASRVILAIIALAGLFLILHYALPSHGDKQATGQIKIETTPKGADILLDNVQTKKESPATIEASPGQHKVKLQLKGYDEQEVLIEVKKGETKSIEHTFVVGGLSTIGSPASNGQARTTYNDDELTIYRSDKYNFSIKYPKDWLAQTDPNGIPHFYNQTGAKKAKQDPGAELEESLAILVLENPKQLGPEAWYKAREEYAQEDQSSITQETVTINGLPAYRYQTPYGFVPYLNTIFTRGDKAYLLQQKVDSPDRKIYDQMLQTFTLP